MEPGQKSAAIFKVAYAVLLGGILLCALIAVIGPEKSLQLYPFPGAAAHLYADSVEPNGTSVARWVNRSESAYECEIGYGVPYPYCGLVIKYKKVDSHNYNVLDYFEFTDATTIDLSEYDGIYVSIDYTGASNALNLYMRNTEKPPLDHSEYERVPYVHVDFSPKGGDIFIEFSRMQLARWWADRYNPPPELRQPKFDHVFEMAIDLPTLPPEGTHEFKLKRIFAKKSYISQQQIFIAISGLAGAGVLVFLMQWLQMSLARRYTKENETLRSALVVDPLTRCLNRLGLETAVGGVFPLSNCSSVYVMVLDLDHFKKINDTLGHAAGDEVLRKAATVLAKELRGDDVFGRWGGEEFIIISRIGRDNLENLIERLMNSLRSITLETVAEPCQVSMSVGVTEALIGEAFVDVFQRADDAMYQVKQAGRGSWKLV